MKISELQIRLGKILEDYGDKDIFYVDKKVGILNINEINLVTDKNNAIIFFSDEKLNK